MAFVIDFSSTAIGIGPGLGKTKEARKKLEAVINSNKKLVLDADAINLLQESDNYELKNELISRYQFAKYFMNEAREHFRTDRFLNIEYIAPEVD